MSGQRYPTCRACGCRKYHKTREEAKADADKARELLARLLLKYGSIVAVAKAYADRHDTTATTAQRRLYRLKEGRHALYNPFLVDELEVML
jgi:predicted  nucleic acid-binding Zn-ribbon protein